MQDIILVSFGAILGSNLRFIIYETLEKYKLNNNLRILFVNTFASFFLGFFLSIIPQVGSLDFSYQLVLFFLIGFLGSFSTFSTFVYDLFVLLLQSNFFQALKLFVTSIALGIIAIAFGFYLGTY
tara:strand:- start:197 stop:571 length:375 start_codon:yes stop_codon:yes gene_type:complete